MADFNFNLGDANSINGDVNVENKVIERDKSKKEIVLEQENQYRIKCREFLSDNLISAEERSVLDKLGAELGINTDRQQEILKNEIEANKSKHLTLDKTSSVLFLQFVKKLKAYDMEGMLKLYPRLKNMEAAFEDPMVKFYYFLLTSLVRPSECINRYESHKEDNYWLTYWTVLAYKMRRQAYQAERAKDQLSLWPEFEEENRTLLNIAISIIDSDWEMAEAFRTTLEGNYSEELASFAATIFTLVNNKDCLNEIDCESEQLLYLDGFFYLQANRKSLGVLNSNGSLSPAVSPASKPTTTWEHQITPLPVTPITPISFTKEQVNELKSEVEKRYYDTTIRYEAVGDDLFIIGYEWGDFGLNLWDSRKEELLLDKKCQALLKVTSEVFLLNYNDKAHIYFLSSKSISQPFSSIYYKENVPDNYLAIEDNKKWGLYDIIKNDLCVPIQYKKSSWEVKTYEKRKNAKTNKWFECAFSNSSEDEGCYIFDYPLNRLYYNKTTSFFTLEHDYYGHFNNIKDTGIICVTDGTHWAMFCLGNLNSEAATDYIFEKLIVLDAELGLIGVMVDGLFGIWDGLNGGYIIEPQFLDPSKDNGFEWEDPKDNHNDDDDEDDDDEEDYDEEDEENDSRFKGDVLILKNEDGNRFYFNVKTLKYE